MFMRFNLMKASNSNHQTFSRKAIMLLFPIKEGENRCIILNRSLDISDKKFIHQLDTWWSMVLLGPTFSC